MWRSNREPSAGNSIPRNMVDWAEFRPTDGEAGESPNWLFSQAPTIKGVKSTFYLV